MESYLVLWSFVVAPSLAFRGESPLPAAILSTTLIYFDHLFQLLHAPGSPGTLRCGPCIKLESAGLHKSDLLETFLSPGSATQGPGYRSSGPTWAKIFAFPQE